MPRALSTRYAERDVADVEAYVRSTIADLGILLDIEERERLVRSGILMVWHIAVALPPEASLVEVLRKRLGSALLDCHREGAPLHRPGALGRSVVPHAA